MNISSQPRSLFARIFNCRMLLTLAVTAGFAAVTPVQAQDAPQGQSAPQEKSAAPQGQSTPQEKSAAPQEQGAPQSETPEQNKQMQEIQGVHAEYMDLQKRLAQIQQDTLQAHPELQKQEQAWRDLILEKMSSNGKNAQEDMAEIKKIEEKLRSGETPDSDRQALMSDYQKKAMAFRDAQTQAMQNPDVQAAQKKLSDAIVTAMKEKDPQTEQLIEQMKQKEQQLSQMLKAAGHTP